MNGLASGVHVLSTREGEDERAHSEGDQGRGVFLDQSHAAGLAAGTVVLQCAPFAKILNLDHWRSRCQFCLSAGESAEGASIRKLSRCGTCKAVYYCSLECQKSDWKPDHQLECKKLSPLLQLRLRADQIADVLLLGRVTRRLASAESLLQQQPETYLPTDLVWFEPDLDQETVLVAALAQKLGFVDAKTPIPELQRMLSRFQNNNFSICDGQLIEIGAGCYPLGAMANHSCDANCAVTYSGDRAQFRAIRDIVPGEELTQTYVDMALPRRERQRRLLDRYRFQCTCNRCQQPMDDPTSLDARLDADVDGIPQEQWTTERNEALAPLRAMMQQPEPEESDGDSSGKTFSSRQIDRLERILALQQAQLHPENIALLQSYAALFSTELERGDLPAAIRYGERMLAFYGRVYPKNHPMRGLHCFTMGDIEHEHDAVKARAHWQAAQEVLRVTHGRDHELVMLLGQRLSSSSV